MNLRKAREEVFFARLNEMFLKAKKLLYLTVILLNSVETFAFTPSIPTLEQILGKKEG